MGSICFEEFNLCSSGSDCSEPEDNFVANSKSYRLLDVISGHVESVSCLALCGEFVLSASKGKDIIVWQQPDLRQFTKFGAGEGSVKAVIAVGNQIFSAHQDGKIRVWKLSMNNENIFRLVDTLPTTMDYKRNLMNQGNCMPMSMTMPHKKLWIEHLDSISCLAVSNGLIYSGSWDKTLKVWRLSDLTCLESINAHDEVINGLVVHDDLVYSASADGNIKVWEQKGASHRLKATLEGHKDVSMNAVIVSEGDGMVFGGMSDGYLLGWERNAKGGWELVVEVKAHQLAILCLCFMGEILCTGSADKNICLWRREDLGDGILGGIYKVEVIRGHKGPVKCLQASPYCVGEGFLLYSGSNDKSLRVWWVSKGLKEPVEEEQF